MASNLESREYFCRKYRRCYHPLITHTRRALSSHTDIWPISATAVLYCVIITLGECCKSLPPPFPSPISIALARERYGARPEYRVYRLRIIGAARCTQIPVGGTAVIHLAFTPFIEGRRRGVFQLDTSVGRINFPVRLTAGLSYRIDRKKISKKERFFARTVEGRCDIQSLSGQALLQRAYAGESKFIFGDINV